MANTSGLRGGLERKRSMGRSSNVASGDACGDEWDDGDRPPKPWVGGESCWGVVPRTSLAEDGVDQSSDHNL